MLEASLIYTLLATLCFSVSDSARILAVATIPSYSHQIAFRPIWRVLSLRGHNITLITTDPINDPSLTNLTEIDVHDVTYDVWKASGFIQTMKEDQKNPIAIMSKYLEVLAELADTIMNQEKVKSLLNSDVTFDLVMTEPIHPLGLGFAGYYKIKFISVMSFEAPSKFHAVMGNALHPVLYPEVALPFRPNSYLRRLYAGISVVFNAILGPYFNYFTNELLRKHFGEDLPPLKEILDRTSMLFVNLNPIFAGVRPLTPSTIFYGGGSHLQPEKPLPADLKTFLDEAENGVIYFSLGTNVFSKDLPEEKRKIFLDTFRELPFKFLWKFEDDSLEELPSKVKIAKWIPQQDVLRHPNIKAFITQAGLQSTEEAIFTKVPIIGMPQLGDQMLNVERIVELGMGVQADFENLNKDELKRLILDVATNKSYRKNMEHFINLTTDRPMSGIEEAVWWTEYVLRHNSTEHLKGPARNIPTYQYLLLDVIGTVVVVVFVVIYLFLKLGKFIVRVLVNGKSHRD